MSCVQNHDNSSLASVLQTQREPHGADNRKHTTLSSFYDAVLYEVASANILNDNTDSHDKASSLLPDTVLSHNVSDVIRKEEETIAASNNHNQTIHCSNHSPSSSVLPTVVHFTSSQSDSLQDNETNHSFSRFNCLDIVLHDNKNSSCNGSTETESELSSQTEKGQVIITENSNKNNFRKTKPSPKRPLPSEPLMLPARVYIRQNGKDRKKVYGTLWYVDDPLGRSHFYRNGKMLSSMFFFQFGNEIYTKPTAVQQKIRGVPTGHLSCIFLFFFLGLGFVQLFFF